MPTPETSGEPFEREVLEPIVVLRPRRTDALADLFRELTELSVDDTPDQEKTRTYEAVNVSKEPQTQRIPPLPPLPPRRRAAPPPPAQPATGRGVRRAAGVIAVSAAALVGFAAAILLLPGRQNDAAAAQPPVASAPAQETPATPAPSPPAQDQAPDPDGAGVLREGATGPEVVTLQERLRRIPNVYDDGATNGRYDATLTEAVARFQLWYGIRGDESGVYGDNTRHDLESRTS
ncbi:peptidoglycan-binding domain-containing protein [Streptomyces sp. 4F14]|uniref:peptidoglycan-binding domain-containing protein n=1 Tax=Streptomyces sp. 4F14 TaxID=3394380 RepID=UPI003A8B6DE3